jgi:hypothetical protein
VIVATETASGGPWTASFGCYGISLRTGELLWPVDREEGGWLGRFLGFLPGFGSANVETPVAVRGSQCVCESGRVLDIHSGSVIGENANVEEWRNSRSENGASWNL